MTFWFADITVRVRWMYCFKDDMIEFIGVKINVFYSLLR